MKENYDIEDNEVRVVGSGNAPDNGKKRITAIVVATILLVAIVIGIVVFFAIKSTGNQAPDNNNSDTTQTSKISNTSDKNLTPYIATADTVIDGIELQILTPINATAELHVGPIDTTDDILLATQAADLGKGKYDIIGAFVYAGEPLSWGLSKKGFCAIINDTITVGVAENSPLFEQATETEGFFFRQYAAVNNGKMVENNPKNTSTRRALCILNNKVCVVTTPNRVTMNDFSHALTNLGTSNAIFLVGSSAHGWYRDNDNKLINMPNSSRWNYNLKNINYIVFRR